MLSTNGCIYVGMVADMPGELIHKARSERGWSLAHVGRAVGVTGEAVRKWEAGRAPDRPTAHALDELFGLNGQLVASLGYSVAQGAVTLEDVDAKIDRLLGEVGIAVSQREELAGTIAETLTALRTALVLLHSMEARQRRAFDLMHLDPSVDLDDARLDDPTYRAAFEAGRPPPEDPPEPAAAGSRRRRHRSG